MGLTMLCSCYCNELLTVTKVPCSLHVSLIDLSIFFFLNKMCCIPIWPRDIFSGMIRKITCVSHRYYVVCGGMFLCMYMHVCVCMQHVCMCRYVCVMHIYVCVHT